MPKRLSMNGTDFGPRPSPADKLLHPNNRAADTDANEIANDTDAENEVEMTTPSQRTTLEPNRPNKNQQSKLEEYQRTSFYLTESQLDKLDDFARALSKRRRERLNRQDVLRRLVDDFKIDVLLENWD